MPRHLRLTKVGRFADDRRGTTAILFAMTAFGVLLATAATIDYGRTLAAREDGQAALDGAVLAAAVAPDGTYAKVGEDELRAQLGTRYTLSSVEFSRTSDGVTSATATVEVPLAFSGVLGVDGIDATVAASAIYKAASSGSGTNGAGSGGAGGNGGGSSTGPGTPSGGATPVPCVFLKGATGQTLTMNGGAAFVAPGCVVAVATTTAQGAVFNSSTTQQVQEICLAGPSAIQNGGPVTPLKVNCTQPADPYAGKLPPEPSTSKCDVKDKNYEADIVDLEPGVYCGNFNFNRPSTVRFAPGLYVLAPNANMNVNGGVWEGTGVTFYFANENAKIQFNSGVKAKLSPPTSGDYAGFLFYEKAGLPARQWVFNPTSGHEFSGIFYLPSREVTVNAGAGVAASKVTMVFRSLLMNTADWTFAPFPKPDAAGGGSSTPGGSTPPAGGGDDHAKSGSTQAGILPRLVR